MLIKGEVNMLRKITNIFNKMIINLINSLRRFPETILLVIGLVVAVILLNHNVIDEQNRIINIIVIILIGMPLSATIVLITERVNLKVNVRILLDFIAGFLLIGYNILLPKPMTQQFMIYTVSLIIIFYLSFTLVPYFYKKERYTVYCIKLMTSFFITYLYTLVLYAGIAAMIFTVNQLFNLSIQDEIYADMFIITTGLFGVTYYLGSLPTVKTTLAFDEYPKIIRVLFLSIIMPLLCIYTLILYAYFTKILINQSWPENLVGNLVLWYGWIGMFILFCISELGEKNSWPLFFRRLFPVLFIIPLGMLFSTIWIRTSEYGLTLARYYVWLSAIWFLVNVIFYVINKWQYGTFIISSLLVFVFVSAFGPFSGYNLSVNNQSNRLENSLLVLNMIQDGKIIKRSDLSVKEKDNINSILYYLDSIDALVEIDYLPKGFDLSQTEEVFGYVYEYEYGEAYYNYYYESVNEIKDTSSYDYVVNFNTGYQNENFDIKGDRLQLTIDNEGLLTVYNDGKIIASQSIYDIIFEMNQKLQGKQINNQEELMYIIKSSEGTIVIEWSSLHGKVVGGTSVTVDSMMGRIWVDLP